MKTNIYKPFAIAALACTALAANAEKTYVQVTAPDQIGAGTNYAICPAWTDVTGVHIFEHDGTSFKWSATVGDTPAFTESQLWQLQASNVTCTGHTDNNHVLMVTRNGQSVNVANPPAFTFATSNANTATQGWEFVPVAHNTLGNVFKVHACGRNGSSFPIVLGWKKDGTSIDKYTATNANGVVVATTGNFSSVVKVYIEFDTENIAAVAQSLWNGKRRAKALGNPDAASIILSVEYPADKNWESTDFTALCTEVQAALDEAVDNSFSDIAQTVITNGNAFKALGIATNTSAWETACAETTWNLTKYNSLISAYEQMVESSASLAGNKYVKFAAGQKSGAYMYLTDANQLYRSPSLSAGRDVMTLIPADGGFKIYNEYMGRYLKHTTADYLALTGANADEASVYKFDLTDGTTALYGIRLVSNPNPTSDREYLHSNQNTNDGSGNIIVMRWSKDPVSSWYISQAEETDAASQAYAGATNMSVKFDNITSGESLGQYTFTNKAPYDTAKTAFSAIGEDAQDSEKLDKAHALADAYYNVTCTLNDVRQGTLVRIKYADDKVYGMNDTNSGFFADNGLNSIFYYSTDNKLENLGKGFAVATTGSAGNQDLNGISTADQNTAGTHGVAVTFGKTTANALAANQGKYLVNYMSNTTARSMGYYASGTANVGRGTGVSETNTEHTLWFHNVENVSAVPVAIHSDGYGSIVCPVALIAPENCTTYVAKQGEGNKIAFDELDEGATIPAGAHAFIKSTANTTVNVCVNYDAEVSDAYSAARLIGSHLVKAHTPATGTNLYAKADAPSSIMLLDATEPIKLVKLTPDETGKVIAPAGAALVSLDSDVHDDDVISIDPQKGVSTGIKEITEVIPTARNIYNLQGQRLANAAEGINIINGRKVLVK